jgi:MORN repeat variant
MEQIHYFLLSSFIFLKPKYFMKKLTTFFATLFLISSSYAAFATGIFDKNFTGQQVEHFADGIKKYEVNVIKGKKQGLETFWYPNGKPNIQTNYVDDKEDGIWKQWYERGQL